MNQPSTLQALLGDVPTGYFVEEHYLRLPYERSQGTREALAPWTLESFGLETFCGESRDVIVGRKGHLSTAPKELTQNDILRFLADGQTIGLRHAHRNDVRLATLAESFRHELAGEVDVHLYWTPAGQQGFGWHYDAEEVFVLQLAGTKTWSLRKNTVNPWPLMDAIPANQKFEREIMPIRDYLLVPGSWMYIPGGYWHSTRAGEESLSLSIGVRAPVAIDLLSGMHALFQQSIEWRERLPCVGAASVASQEELDAAHCAIFDRLVESFSSALRHRLFGKLERSDSAN